MSRTTWRVGRKLGRTIYVAVGPEPSDDDQLIGMMDTADIAETVVRAFNAHRYTVDSYLVGPAVAPCLICGRGRQDHDEPCPHTYWNDVGGGRTVCRTCGADTSHLDEMGG